MTRVVAGRATSWRAVVVSLVVVASAEVARGQETSPDGLWRSVPNEQAAAVFRQNALVFGRLNVSHLLQLSPPTLRQVLERVQREDLARGAVAAVTTMFMPMPDESWHAYHVVETSILPPDLGRKYRATIRTYRGWSPSDPRLTLRMELIDGELRAQVWTPTELVRLEPVSATEGLVTLSLGARRPGRAQFACGTGGDGAPPPASRPDDASLRVYRLAMACTGEYAVFHGGAQPPTVAKALAAIVTTMNRVNGIYERDLAVQFQLVEQSEKLIFLVPDKDPFTNNMTRTLINESQVVIDDVVKSTGYDVGHTLSTGAGGLAVVRAIERADAKAKGVTGIQFPIGDPFDIDYVAHELGHQLGANHTFNGTGGECGKDNQRNPATAFEPGSGSTILAYAGICHPDNLQPNTDPYFHSASLEEILACTARVKPFQRVSTANRLPRIKVAPDHDVPASTPFVLRADVTDPDGDEALTVCWEQRDVGQAATLTNSNGNGPLFRSFPPSADPARWFPRYQDLLDQVRTPGERLAATTRTLSFRAVVRDNAVPAGAVAWADTVVRVHALQKGAFRVVNPTTGTQEMTLVTVTWNKFGTDVPPISTMHVKISLSVDDGVTWPHVLAASTDNDGEEKLALPGVEGSNARIRIEAIGNVYFAISDRFRVVAAETSMILIPERADVGSPQLGALLTALGAREVSWIGAKGEAVARDLADWLGLTLLAETEPERLASDFGEGVPQARVVVYAVETVHTLTGPGINVETGSSPIVLSRRGEVVESKPLQ